MAYQKAMKLMLILEPEYFKDSCDLWSYNLMIAVFLKLLFQSTDITPLRLKLQWNFDPDYLGNSGSDPNKPYIFERPIMRGFQWCDFCFLNFCGSEAQNFHLQFFGISSSSIFIKFMSKKALYHTFWTKKKVWKNIERRLQKAQFCNKCNCSWNRL